MMRSGARRPSASGALRHAACDEHHVVRRRRHGAHLERVREPAAAVHFRVGEDEAVPARCRASETRKRGAVPPRAPADRAERLARGRDADDAGGDAIPVEEADADAPRRQARHESRGPVDGIDDGAPPARPGDGRALLALDAEPGRARPERLHHVRLDRAIRGRDDRPVGLPLGDDLLEARERDLARVNRDRFERAAPDRRSGSNSALRGPSRAAGGVPARGQGAPSSS
jgi:hypothetical protein